MLNITLSPIASDHDTIISVNGLIIIYDGVSYDLSSIPNGGQADAISPAIGKITNTAGTIDLTLEYYYDTATSLPNQSADITDYIWSGDSGTVSGIIQRVS